MAAGITRATGVKPELVKGVDGVFDVVADGAVIYSKHLTGRFPDDDEIIRSLQAAK